MNLIVALGIIRPYPAGLGPTCAGLHETPEGWKCANVACFANLSRGSDAGIDGFAEFERDILRDRVKAGIDQARKDGKPHGRKVQCHERSSPRGIGINSPWCPLVPVRHLLISVREAEHPCFIERTSNELKPDGHAVSVETAWNGQSGMPGKIERGDEGNAAPGDFWVSAALA